LQVLAAIDSVLSQTIPVEEIIVVDDGSTDGTAEAISTLYGSSVRVFRQENAGVSAARNRGIREATGEWIAFLDSDDLWLPTKIESQIESLASFGAEAGFCFTDCTFYGNPDMRLSAFEAVGFANLRMVGLLEDPAKVILASLEPFYTPSILVRRSLLAEVGSFDETLFIREDTDLFFRLSFKTKFCYVGEPLVQADRTPSRSLGLCDSYATLHAAGDDRVFDGWVRLYRKWLAMPEIDDSAYDRLIRELLREVYYNSAESKLHHLRIGPALQEIGRLRDIEGGFASILGTLLLRKAKKLRRKIGAMEHRGSAASDQSGTDLSPRSQSRL
jgi:glycosyltransferase involved in cell wall biosynthesis